MGTEAEEAQGQEEAGGGQEDRVKGCRSPTENRGEEKKESEGDREWLFVRFIFYNHTDIKFNVIEMTSLV